MNTHSVELDQDMIKFMDNLTDNNHHMHSGNKPNKYIAVIIFLLSLGGMFYAFSGPSSDSEIKGTVIEILSERDSTLDLGMKNKTIKEQSLLVEIKIGGEKSEINVLNDYKPVLKGDIIFVSGSVFGESEFNVVNISRTRELIFLLIFFIILVFITSGWKGLYSLIGLLFSFSVIFAFIVPFILKGIDPISIGIIGAAIILIPTLYLSYGLNKKSIAAFLGIIIALIFVGLISNYAINALQFTGQTEASLYLDMETSNTINFIGLLIAGIIIAAVGVLDDVAVIQSSVVFSLAGTNSGLRGFKLFKEAMHVGKDHISAVVNTLVLAYTGASLPLIILLYLRKMPVEYFTSIEMVAEEIARTLISSSGLLLAVPLTTIIAVFMVDRKYNKIKNN